MHKESFAIVLITIIVAISVTYILNGQMTGFGSLGVMNVSIVGKTEGRLILGYDQFLETGNPQNIYAEFEDTGTTPVDVKISVNVYFYNVSKMNLTAAYEDSTAPLKSGERRGYSTVFMPPTTGLYYIEGKAVFNNKIIETWAAFVVYYNTNNYSSTGGGTVQPVNIIQIVNVVTISSVSGGGGTPKMSVECPEKISISQGDSGLFNINVTNTGNRTLNNLGIFVSTSDSIKFDVYPKQVGNLPVNKSTTFLFSLEIPTTTPTGIYAFDFTVTSNEVSSGKSVFIEVTGKSTDEDYVKQKLLDYQLLISDVERQIVSAKLSGYDVGIANQSLNSAKISYGRAKEYSDSNKFGDARKELDNVKQDLENAMLQLASAQLYVYKTRAIINWWVIIGILILISGIVIFIFVRRKMKRRRPKLLRDMGEVEENK
jgi:hypothetical protein